MLIRKAENHELCEEDLVPSSYLGPRWKSIIPGISQTYSLSLKKIFLYATPIFDDA